MRNNGFCRLLIYGFMFGLFAGCDDTPPDPNPPYVPPDGMYNVTELTDAAAANPAAFDTSDFIKMKGSWEDFSSTAGAVSAYKDPLGKLYYALRPFAMFTTKKVMLDFSNVSGRNIGDSNPVNSSPESRPAQNVISAIRFPPDMLYIGMYSFSGCASLTTVFFTGETRPLIGSSAFPDGATLIDETEEAVNQNIVR